MCRLYHAALEGKPLAHYEHISTLCTKGEPLAHNDVIGSVPYSGKCCESHVIGNFAGKICILQLKVRHALIKMVVLRQNNQDEALG